MGTRTHQQIIAAWDAAAGQMSAFGEEGADRGCARAELRCAACAEARDAVNDETVGAAQVNAGRVGAIILAAGRSSRMGAHKLLLPLNGKPLLAWSVAAVSASSARPIIVTLGRAADEVAATLSPGPYTTVVNPQFAEGMGTSLALAVSHLPRDVAGALIVLGDQPFMPTSAIEAVLAAARAQPERIAMGVYGQRRGHPVYLPRQVFSDLLALKDDEGARTLIARAGAEITLVAIDAEHALLDVDTQDDYQRAQAIAAHSAANRPA